MSRPEQKRDNPFWDFSVRVYNKDHVAPACLSVQERLGVDVNLLLFCCWLAVRGDPPLCADALAGFARHVGVWHDRIVRPLRAVRQDLKGGVDPAPAGRAAEVRRKILALELECERIEQDALFQSAGRRAGKSVAAPHKTAIANLDLYLAHLGVRPAREDLDNLCILVEAAVGGGSDDLKDLFSHREQTA